VFCMLVNSLRSQVYCRRANAYLGANHCLELATSNVPPSTTCHSYVTHTHTHTSTTATIIPYRFPASPSSCQSTYAFLTLLPCCCPFHSCVRVVACSMYVCVFYMNGSKMYWRDQPELYTRTLNAVLKLYTRMRRSEGIVSNLLTMPRYMKAIRVNAYRMV